MKARIDRKVFAQALAEVAPFAPQKAAIAVLKYAKITTKDKYMKIEANDSKASIVKYIEMLECNTNSTFLVEIAELTRFISKIEGNEIELTVIENTIQIKHSKGEAEFQSVSDAEYPVFKMPEEDVTEITLDAKLLADAISYGRDFIMQDQTKPQMGTIYAFIKDGEFGFCSTNTTRLIYGHQRLNAHEGLDIHWYIMPAVFAAILRLCKDVDLVKIKITPTHVSYRLGSVLLQTIQVLGNYPNFRRVIPQTWDVECAVDKSEIISALNRASLFCELNGCVKFDFSQMDVTVTVDNLLQAKKSVEQITHNGCNGTLKIGVNVSNALASMGVFNSGEILIRMSDANRPILIVQQGNDNLQCVCMPMQLNGYE